MAIHSENGKSPRKRSRPIVAALAFTVLSLFPQTVLADGVVSPQVFSRGSFVYVVDEGQITLLSMDTRSAYVLYSSDDSLFNIASAARFGDMIWASNNMGAVIAVNMQTSMIEDFSHGVVGGGGYIDVDRRFVWLAAGGTLYRMDIVSREWVKLPIPSKGVAEVRGLIAFSEQVHVITSSALHVLTIASDDWVSVPHKDFALTRGDFRRVGEAAYFTQAEALYRYDPSKRLFVKADARDTVRSVSFASDRIDAVIGERAYTFNARHSSLEPQPAIPMLRGIRSISRLDMWTVGVTESGLLIYTTPFDFSVARYPDHISVSDRAFAFGHASLVILYTRGGFVIYNPDRKLWSRVRAVGRERAQKGVIGWDESGAHVNFSDKYGGVPTGALTFRQHPSAEYSDTGGLNIDPMAPLPNVVLNLRTVDPEGRVIDVTIDNAVTTLPPQKGFYYKGVSGDILDRASFGVQGTGLAPSAVSPDVVTEGAMAALSGRNAATGRDRSFAAATFGSGYILSKTQWRTLPYQASGVYNLRTPKEIETERNGIGLNEIAPGSVRAHVDGVPLAGTDFFYNPVARSVTILRREKTNPTSVIQVSFSEKTSPDDRSAFEPLPSNHFGQYNFAEGVLSPRRWMSARAGLLTVDRPDSAINAIVLAGAPVEWRGANGRFALVYPEIAYDSRFGAHSAGITAGAREGAAFGSYRGQWVGRDFEGLDRPTFAGYGLNDEHELNLGYDLRSNLRASIRQLHRRTVYSSLSNVELHALYTGGLLMPDIEMSASSQFFEDGLDAAATRAKNHKESVTLRLSDLPSRHLRGANSLHSIGYDLSWTEYMSSLDERGRVIYGSANISPTSSLTVTGSGTYRLNPTGYYLRAETSPSLTVNTRDLPRGFDVTATFATSIADLAVKERAVDVGVNAYGYFYPGEYVGALAPFVLYAGYTSEMQSLLQSGASTLEYVFRSGELTAWRLVSNELGLIFSPTDNLLLTTINTRLWDMATNDATYITSERATLLLSGGGNINAGLSIGKSPSALTFSGEAIYEHNWYGGVLIGAGAFAGRQEVDSAMQQYAGPIVTASIAKELNGFIKSIENSHRLRIALHVDDTSTPDLSYALYLRLKTPPNISLVAEMFMNLYRMKYGNMGSGLYLHAGF